MNKVLPFIVLIALLSVTCCQAGNSVLKPDTDGYIHNWLLLEPIALDDKASNYNEENQKPFFDKEYFPAQRTTSPKEGEKVKVGADDLTWKSIQADEAIVTFDDAKENSLYLAVVYVNSEKEVADAMLSIGSDDSSQWLVNGQEVLRVYSGRPVDKDQNKSKPFTLKKGVNVVYAAIINGEDASGLSARILDKAENPITGLTISLVPPTK